MAQRGEHNTSDDEFLDAISDAAPSKSPEKTDKDIDELIAKVEKESLADDPSSSEGATSNNAEPELLEDIVDEDELREEEKTMSEEEIEQRREEAHKLKLEGNNLFKSDENAQLSIEAYSKALQICPTKYNQERAILYGNRAAAKIKLDSKKSAICDCTKAIELWPEYVRALLRRAKLYELEDKLEDALGDYKRVYDLDPGQQDAREAMIRLPPIIKERNERMKEEMMTNLKSLGNMILKPFGLSTSNFQMQQDPNSGSYSINFNQN